MTRIAPVGFPVGMPGRMEASTTNKLFVPQTFVLVSTTELVELVPIMAEPVQWLEPATVLVTKSVILVMLR